MRRQLCSLAIAAALGFAAAPASAAAISDDFEVDSSANYTIVDDSNGASGDGGADSTSTFAYDYVGAGIPLAPNSTAGDRGGLRLTVNATEEGPEGPTTSEEDHITAFHNMAQSGYYRLDVDMYMGVEALQPGTTEMAHVGVAGSTTDFTSIFTPIVDNGYFISITGEGGSSSDYRMSAPGEPAIPSGDSRYLNDLNTTNATGDKYQALYPATDFPGSPGNSWTTLSIIVDPVNVLYQLDGVTVMWTPNVGGDGLVSLGYIDPFDSVGPHFVIYDNLSVTELVGVPEPTSAALALLGFAGLMGRRRG